MQQSDDTTQNPTVDLSLLTCRVLDVQQALQKAYAEFTQQSDNSLDTLTLLIQEHLNNIPAFIVEYPSQQE